MSTVRDAAWRWCAGAAAFVGPAALVAAAVIRGAPGWPTVAGSALAGASIGAAGWVLAGRRSTVGVARPFCWSATFFAVTSVIELGAVLSTGQAAELLGWLAGCIWPLFVVPLLTWLLLVFPDGHLLPGRLWTGLAGTAVLAVVCLAAGQALSATRQDADQTVLNPWAALPAASDVLFVVGDLAWAVAGLGGVVSLAVRWARGDSLTRARLVLVGSTLATVVLLYAAHPLLPQPVSTAVGTLWPPVLVLVIALAIWRHGLWEDSQVITRTQVYVLIVLVLSVVYVAVVALLGALFLRWSSAGVAVAGAVAVALVFEPVRRTAHRFVASAFFGDRLAPLSAIARLRQATEASGDPDSVFAALAQAIADSVRSPGVELWAFTADGSSLVAAVGTVGDDAQDVVLEHSAEQVGLLRLAPRTAGGPWSRTDRQLIEHVAREAAATVAVVSRRAELDAARIRMLVSEADRRAALGRELHDGIGPMLAGSYLALQGVERSLAGSDEATSVSRISTDLQRVMAEVRRMINGAQPGPADAESLAEALRTHVAGIEHPRITLTTDLGEIPAAVAGTTYLIAMEALTNVLRHARARTAQVAIVQTGDRVEVVVTDDGTLESYVAGIGLRSMRSRAAEFGGSVEFGATSEGTRLRAVLPIGAGDG